jgi:prepilin-type N-terminal cleavage/methylation domain-containing protein
MRKNKGFSLIELLIVVAIILIIAAIAIPNLLRARIASNEASAATSLRTIVTAETAYANAYPQAGYTATIANLGPGAGNTACPATGPTSAGGCLIDAVLAGATTNPKNGYFVAIGGSGAVPEPIFVAGAAPANFNQTGVRRFCGMADGVIRQDPNTAGSTTPITAQATCGNFPPL